MTNLIQVGPRASGAGHFEDSGFVRDFMRQPLRPSTGGADTYGDVAGMLRQPFRPSSEGGNWEQQLLRGAFTPSEGISAGGIKVTGGNSSALAGVARAGGRLRGNIFPLLGLLLNLEDYIELGKDLWKLYVGWLNWVPNSPPAGWTRRSCGFDGPVCAYTGSTTSLCGGVRLHPCPGNLVITNVPNMFDQIQEWGDNTTNIVMQAVWERNPGTVGDFPGVTPAKAAPMTMPDEWIDPRVAMPVLEPMVLPIHKRVPVARPLPFRVVRSVAARAPAHRTKPKARPKPAELTEPRTVTTPALQLEPRYPPTIVDHGMGPPRGGRGEGKRRLGGRAGAFVFALTNIITETIDALDCMYWNLPKWARTPWADPVARAGDVVDYIAGGDWFGGDAGNDLSGWLFGVGQCFIVNELGDRAIGGLTRAANQAVVGTGYYNRVVGVTAGWADNQRPPTPSWHRTPDGWSYGI